MQFDCIDDFNMDMVSSLDKGRIYVEILLILLILVVLETLYVS